MSKKKEVREMKKKWLGCLMLASVLILPVSVCAGELEEISVEYLRNQEEWEMDTLTQHGVITSETGYVEFSIIGDMENPKPYRVSIVGADKYGQEFRQYESFYGSEHWFGFAVSSATGTYGPYEIQIVSGADSKVYPFSVQVTEEAASAGVLPEGAGMAEYGYVSSDVFLNVPSPEQQSNAGYAELPTEGAGILSPFDGGVCYGTQGMNLEIEVGFGENIKNMTLDLKSIETGEVVSVHDGSYVPEEGYEGYWGFSYYFDEFSSGEKYEIILTADDYEYTSEFTLVDEGETKWMAMGTEAVYEGEWVVLGEPLNNMVYIPKNWTFQQPSEEMANNGTVALYVDPNVSGSMIGISAFPFGPYYDMDEFIAETGFEPGTYTIKTVNGIPTAIEIREEYMSLEEDGAVAKRVYYLTEYGLIYIVDMIMNKEMYVGYMDSLINATRKYSVYTDQSTVMAVQTALNEAGYNCGTPDGVAGANTNAAITQYQQEKGLYVSGCVDTLLLEAMGIAG